ncbi:twin-arginine translocation pathway signal protein [Labrenzia sp. PHM005]|uniref:Acg family FMN-binding oxidoreductase n=1 Tax=Labrenzia sp. PHM005 TaxID=2590016 RepID=UPI0011401027|nr:twin-arginine translocation pathway signal protein [Labrenzia sp. PHM005]QDG77893.1 twin-arginine translocation pathway signal protein [Labrenzia sp. PHM005]
MTVSRRKTLALLGGGLILAATASAGAFVATRSPEKALQPWEKAGTYDDPRLFALSYALLAPNPHNRQPWLIELTGDDAFRLHRDETRDLPHTDPHLRQIFVGLGCFLEQMAIAATIKGFEAQIDLFPDGLDGPIADVRLIEGAKADRLADHIMDRRSCKEPFQEKPVPTALQDELRQYGSVWTKPGDVARIKTLTWDAWMTEMNTHRTLKESVELMRMGKAEINANPDGIDLGGPFLESLMLAGILTRENQLDPTSTGFQEGVKIYTEMLNATPAYISLTTAGNTRFEQIDAGRRWLRLNLETTRLGLALHPVSQALQEFEEMAPHYAEAHRLLAKPGETVQMLGRLGYGPATPRSPRWSLETRIMNG